MFDCSNQEIGVVAVKPFTIGVKDMPNSIYDKDERFVIIKDEDAKLSMLSLKDRVLKVYDYDSPCLSHHLHNPSFSFSIIT